MNKSIAIGMGIALAAILTAGIAKMSAPVNAQSGDLGARVYELRTYYTNPGKLDALHARFRDHTNHLFVRHGMTLVGYWTLDEGEGKDSTLVYMIAHESRESAKASWAGLIDDPDWRAAYAASREDGPLVAKIESKFLNPTAYSPLR